MMWQATHHDYSSTSWWTVDEVDDCGNIIRRIVDCGDNADLARRIAKLPGLEAIVGALLEASKSSLDSLLDGGAMPEEEAVMLLNAAIAEAEGKCPGCGADVEEGPRADGYTQWTCGSNRGYWGVGRSQACREAAEAAREEVTP